MNYCARSAEEAPLYLFDRTFTSQCPELLEDWDCALRKSCPWWAPGNKEAGHDLFGVLGEGRRPDHQWLIVGPKRCVASFALVTAAANFSICLCVPVRRGDCQFCKFCSNEAIVARDDFEQQCARLCRMSTVKFCNQKQLGQFTVLCKHRHVRTLCNVISCMPQRSSFWSRDYK